MCRWVSHAFMLFLFVSWEQEVTISISSHLNFLFNYVPMILLKLSSTSSSLSSTSQVPKSQICGTKSIHLHGNAFPNIVHNIFYCALPFVCFARGRSDAPDPPTHTHHTQRHSLFSKSSVKTRLTGVMASYLS